MTKVMQGVRVLEVAQMTFVPSAGAILADWGADVIKIEHPQRGDSQRGFVNMGGVKVNPKRSPFVEHPNRGKRSVGVDITQPEGMAVIYELAKTADVFLTNYLPRQRQKMKFDIEHIREANPNIIYARGSAYGDKGPERDTGGFDGTAFWNRSGIATAMSPPELSGPISQGIPAFGDSIGGMNIAGGISAALFHRERTGEGQHVDIAMVDALFHMHEMFLQGPALTDYRWKPTRSGAKSRLNAPHGTYRGPEGWIVVQVMPRQWPAFCRAVDPALEHDDRFADMDRRQKNRDELNELIETWMASMGDDDAVIAALESERVPCAKVLAPVDAVGHPHFESRQAIRHVDDPVLGEFPIPANPIRMSAMPEHLELGVADLGEHNAEVLAEAGYTADQIAALTESGVLRT